MATQTLASTWSPTSCPASTDLWEIYLTTSAVFFLLGPLTATSECAPSGYTPTVPYYAASCPTGYTSACAHGLDDATTVCCPTARSMTCASSAKVYNSLTLSCEERFGSSYTAEVTTTSVFVTSGETGTATVVFTPDFDAVNGFGLEYVPMTSTSSSSSTTEATTTATTTSSTSTATATSITSATTDKTTGSSLSGGAIAGIVVAVVAFIVIIALVWNRSKITAWIHRHTAPRTDKADQNTHSNTFQPAWEQQTTGYHTAGMGQPTELDSAWGPSELSSTPQVVEKG
ncbi:hypothetical protein N7507_011673 [Penicillium longicatenatum]|nr:hypothetical protein N7507_011673 [Penicillium longicatenatum]